MKRPRELRRRLDAQRVRYLRRLDESREREFRRLDGDGQRVRELLNFSRAPGNVLHSPRSRDQTL